ncbi:MAG TPA: outer membrane protein assembly factor BamD [Planctomycetota bacterium]|nr:outer membrane protein assembly factor BamD [Planctomycetota bacterium]
MSARGRLAAAALAALAALATGCVSYPLGDPTTALARVQELAAQGDTEGVAELGGRLAQSSDATGADRAEAAFLAAEADFARGEHGKAFQRYRYVLENAPWSTHAAVIEDRLFAIGQAFFDDPAYGGWFSDRARGVEALETLQAHFRTSDRADDALKLVGDYFARDEVAEYGEASLVYERVAEEYPGSEWAERCLWLAGHCNLLLSGGPKYDRNDLLRARDLLDRSLKRYPRGVAAQQSKEDLASAIDQLAEAELWVADYYGGRGQEVGEQLRLANAALLYPETAAGQAAHARLLAAGIDPESLRSDPRRQSLDTVKVSRPAWAQAKEKAAGTSGAKKQEDVKP